MSASVRIAAALLTTLAVLCPSARAERLIATIAPSKISISANYSGRDIVVFGAIAGTEKPQRNYDVVVTVVGPRQDLIVRRKERVWGIWVNRSSSILIGVPSYLAVSANRPFGNIASSEILRYQRLGLKNRVFLDQAVDPDDPFQINLINARIQEGLFVEEPRGVTFFSPTTFRAEIPLPKSAQTGNYKVEVQILADGRPIDETFSSAFDVEKTGLPEFVVTSSINHSLLYGLAMMGLALSAGWFASVAFRRN